MLPYLLSGLLGAVVSMIELIGRYKDAPFSAIKNSYALLYALINALASAATLYLILDANIIPFPEDGIGSSIAAKVIISGIGALTILRVGITLQIAGERLNFSIATLLIPIIQATDNEVDRGQAAHKLKITNELMMGLDVDAALRELPTLCLYLMQSIPQADQKRLADDVKALQEQTLNRETKLISLGSILLNTVGENVLRSAVNVLSKQPNLAATNQPPVGLNSPVG